MEELLKLLNETRQRSSKYGHWLEETNPKIPNSFGMIYNSTVLTLESLSHYYNIWGKRVILPKEEIEHLRQDNAGRIVMLTRWAFISAISSIEYSVKETLKIIENEYFRKLKKRLHSGKRVYLGEILGVSKNKGMIDEMQFRTWQGVLEIRNAIVHNNAIADKEGEYVIDGTKLVFEKGEMLKHKLDFFIRLLGVIIDGHYKWLNVVLS